MSDARLHAGKLMQELACLLANEGFRLHEPAIRIETNRRAMDFADDVEICVEFEGKKATDRAIIDLGQSLDAVSVALRPMAAKFAEALLPLERRPSWRNMT